MMISGQLVIISSSRGLEDISSNRTQNSGLPEEKTLSSSLPRHFVARDWRIVRIPLRSTYCDCFCSFIECGILL